MTALLRTRAVTRRRARRIGDTAGDRWFDIANHTALVALALATLFPLLHVISASFSEPEAVVAGQVWLWPNGWDTGAYEAAFRYPALLTGFANSLFYAVAGGIVSTVLTLLAAYPLARRTLPGRNKLMFLFVFTMFFSGGLIPTYLVVDSLGLLNTRAAMILPGALAVWNMIITRTYFQMTIPDELLESAKVDGCSDFRFLWSIVLPLSKPIIAVNLLFYGLGQWNSFFNALIYLTDESLFPLQLVLRQILVQNEVDPSQMVNLQDLARLQDLRQQLRFAVIVIAAVPPLIIYPFVQKHFVKGVMIGSLKG
ncbi:carbohydrate ABC transporter permease [Microlunatus sp. GCM10028923]|uniref:carbohydrate ABC transporter permease n=1 Tax=Microlunatus sp. GCM10028923 TaxID=3273400 RepID=UPI00360D93DA